MTKTTKTKTPQPKNDTSGRNNFQTPLYALDLIIPFIPTGIRTILEPAAGQMRLVDRLSKAHGYHVLSGDLYPQRQDCLKMDFLNFEDITFPEPIDCVITNPPFSLKFDFISKAMEMAVPFAFLIPFDMCGFLHEKFSQGLQAIVPNRRIDYLTPNIVERINAGENTNYSVIDEVPVKTIKKYSSSDFHSFWITYKFNQPNKFEFVELSLEDKMNVV